MKAGLIRTLAKTAAKALISAALLAFAARGVDFSIIRAQLATANPYAVTSALALITGIYLIHARRWQFVLTRLGERLSFGRALGLVLIGSFFNQVLLSTVGGDGYRIWGAYQSSIDLDAAVSSVIIDRVAALAALLLMIAASLPWLFDLILPASQRWVVILAIAGGGLGMGLLFIIGRFARFLNRWRIGRIALRVADGARGVFLDMKVAASVIALTICGHAILSFAVYLLARGMAVNLGYADSLLLIPLVTLITVLPLSIAGWGIRESAMVVALGLIGISPTAAFSLSVLYGLVIMASGLPGAFMLLTMQRTPVPAVGAVSKSTVNE